MKRPVKIIVIGGNAAGPAAAAKAKRFNPFAEVLLFEASEFISTGTCEIPYALSGEIDDYKKLIFYSPSSFQMEKGVNVFVNHFVEEIDTKKKNIFVKDLIEDKILQYEYDKLVLTTGSKAKSLPGFNSDLANIFFLKSIKDLVKLDQYLKKSNPVKAIIIGSGFIGLESAEALFKRNLKVKIIEREKRSLPISDEEFSEEILNTLDANGVEFIGGTVDIEPIIKEDKVVAVRIDKKIIETDLVLLSIGVEPDTYLAQSAKIELGKSGAIRVDPYLKTSDRFVFAAGDNIEIINFVTHKSDYIPLALHSYELGRIAGENAAGGNVKYDPIVKNISLKVFDKFFIQVGITKEEAKKNRIEFVESSAKARNLVHVMLGSDFVFGKVIAEKFTKRILGASFIGGKEISGYADLISAMISLKTSAEMLSKINYNYTPPLSPFINILNIIGKKFK